MKSIGFRFFIALPAIVLICLGHSTVIAQSATRPVVLNKAPTGTYAAFNEWTSIIGTTNRSLMFTLRLETNGTYIAQTADLSPVQDGDLVRLRPEMSRGKWCWDAQKREFRLEPGDFIFDIKRLKVDEFNSDRILWGHSFLERQEDK